MVDILKRASRVVSLKKHYMAYCSLVVFCLLLHLNTGLLKTDYHSEE